MGKWQRTKAQPNYYYCQPTMNAQLITLNIPRVLHSFSEVEVLHKSEVQ